MFILAILQDHLEDVKYTIDDVAGVEVDGFSQNGFHKFERDVMIRPMVFNDDATAMAADMSTPEGVQNMIAITKTRSLWR